MSASDTRSFLWTVRFEVVTGLSVDLTVFWDVAPSGMIDVY
jgi:hypothetical protein